jgi:hypothetical protein
MEYRNTTLQKYREAIALIRLRLLGSCLHDYNESELVPSEARSSGITAKL